MSEGELNLGSGVRNEDANKSEAQWSSCRETGLVPVPYSFETSGTESDSSSENSSEHSDQNMLSDLSQ